ncbi:lipoprotein-attachment site-containing protein [Nitrosomonas ureae]|jgi:predicted small lipoprotein YifL|uniref:Lipoprotein-attachment site-containing protein n=1 Tax=Nitrosomonas ureae TaxID=44577 RepID=A0A285BXU8_9PROT|nr:lipoprotein [Nitrosomonas ureae]SNX59663.1 lipoprotein-attachment site-containing protein [Nitrosomonas ureae]
MRLVCVVIFLAYSLSACGHKGPLFLPQTDEANRMAPSESETERK